MFLNKMLKKNDLTQLVENKNVQTVENYNTAIIIVFSLLLLCEPKKIVDVW